MSKLRKVVLCPFWYPRSKKSYSSQSQLIFAVFFPKEKEFSFIHAPFMLVGIAQRQTTDR